MREFRHSAGRYACGRVAFYAPAAFLEPAGGALPFVRAGAAGWPTAIAPATLDDVRCGSCGARLEASDVAASDTRMPIILLADRRRPEPTGRLRLTRALLAPADVDCGCVTAKQIADYLQVNPRVITAAMEAGEIAPAFRVGRRGGVGEWRCVWAAARRYCLQLETRVDDPAA